MQTASICQAAPLTAAADQALATTTTAARRLRSRRHTPAATSTAPPAAPVGGRPAQLRGWAGTGPEIAACPPACATGRAPDSPSLPLHLGAASCSKDHKAEGYCGGISLADGTLSPVAYGSTPNCLSDSLAQGAGGPAGWLASSCRAPPDSGARLLCLRALEQAPLALPQSSHNAALGCTRRAPLPLAPQPPARPLASGGAPAPAASPPPPTSSPRPAPTTPTCAGSASTASAAPAA